MGVSSVSMIKLINYIFIHDNHELYKGCGYSFVKSKIDENIPVFVFLFFSEIHKINNKDKLSIGEKLLTEMDG